MLLLFALSCGSEFEARSAPAAVPPPESSAPPVAAATESEAAPSPSVAAPSASATPQPLPPFHPADFVPPSTLSASPGDGQWSAWPAASAEAALLFRSSVHPHPKSRFVRMDVVAIDLRRLTLHWVVGSKDEGAARLAGSFAAGLVPPEFHQRTVAVFNGGFQFRHGRWGVIAQGVALQPLKPDGCVVALRSNTADVEGGEGEPPQPAVALGSGSKWQGREAEFRALRQTPPCLLEDGEIHPWLQAGRTRPWAGQNADLKTRRRSALGIDRRGHTLFYAVGVETEALDLARGMKAVGAATALELDINWYWTRFLLPAPDAEARYRVAETLIEGMEFGKNEYFAQPSERDFFYLLR